MSFAVKGCLAPLRALQRHWPGTSCRAAGPLDAGTCKAVESVLITVANASDVGLVPSSRAQKLHDRLQREQLQETARPMSRRKLACSLERLQGEYEAKRSELRASGLRWSKDWMMGVEDYDADALAQVYARIEAASAVINSAGAARAEMELPRTRPASW